MKTVTVALNSIERAKSFVDAIIQFDSEFDLVSGRYVVDAKSILGVFSLDISKPLKLVIYNTEHIDTILKALAPYIL